MYKLKRYIALLLLISAFIPANSQTVTMSSCEYWLDGAYENRQTVPFDGEWNAELDVSSLSTGVHTLSMRFSDSKNRWSGPITKYFVRTADGWSDNALKSYRYWIDGDFAGGVSGELGADGLLELDLDMSSLAPGVHTLSMCFSDSKNRLSSPITKYFVRTADGWSDNALKSYRYWIDGDFAGGVSGELGADGLLELDLDMSSLAPGVHTLSMCFSDSKNRLSSPITKYFVRTADGWSDNALKSYRYWIDGDFAGGVSGELGTDGLIQLELDMSDLCKGVHTLSVQTEDTYGRKSSPIVRYFVVAGANLADNKISAYEYWFNEGRRTRVEVDPVNPFELTDLWIDIKDVVPHKIPADYRFDTQELTAWCDDDVYFGMQVYDLAGNGTEAVMSDTFAMEVPVKVEVVELSNGIEQLFESPEAGAIKGFSIRTEAGDTLEWMVRQDCVFDLFDNEGTRLSYKSEKQKDGMTLYKAVAGTAVTYGLVHTATTFATEMSITCYVKVYSGLDDNLDEGIAVSTADGELLVTSGAESQIRIVNAVGMTVVSDMLECGENRYKLPSGAYIVQVEGKTVKVLL